MSRLQGSQGGVSGGTEGGHQSPALAMWRGAVCSSSQFFSYNNCVLLSSGWAVEAVLVVLKYLEAINVHKGLAVLCVNSVHKIVSSAGGTGLSMDNSRALQKGGQVRSHTRSPLVSWQTDRLTKSGCS